MNRSLTVLSSGDSIETVCKTLGPLLQPLDDTFIAREELRNVAINLLRPFRSFPPSGTIDSCRRIYLACIVMEVVNPVCIGQAEKIRRLWALARECDDYSASVETYYADLRIEALNMRSTARSAQIGPRLRGQYNSAAARAMREKQAMARYATVA